jgi:hypothetical protein
MIGMKTAINAAIDADKPKRILSSAFRSAGLWLPPAATQ